MAMTITVMETAMPNNSNGEVISMPVSPPIIIAQHPSKRSQCMLSLLNILCLDAMRTANNPAIASTISVK
jgi:hypothetical protein